MSIQALPQTAVRAIGSAQALTDPASVVKELIDNAIDARATSVFVEISANTLDVIQVRDNGHGIAPNDRPLVARRYCTSKIKDEKDLAKIGGSFLGFRGEALSSASEMSGAITITTRVDGEDIATTLKITTDGEISAQERASHPVGTTVRITDFLSRHPVRKQIALKGSIKTINKIKQVLQQYAFARPTTRLSLRVLKAQKDRDNWTYAPRAGADVDETATKVVGKPCAAQCGWHEMEHEGFVIRAFMPRVDPEILKASGAGQYLSVDGRPMSTARGIFKQVVKIFKDSLRRAEADLEGVKDPFLHMSISCPDGAYDPNVEPAKDDVLFEDADVVLSAIRDLFDKAYPAVESRQPAHVTTCMEQFEDRERLTQQSVEIPEVSSEKRMPKETNAYKNNMYDMDEEDLALLAGIADEPSLDTGNEEEDIERDSYAKASSSNPFIMAKMNARTGKTNLGLPIHAQLATPVRDAGSTQRLSSSPVRVAGLNTTQQTPYALPTPRASSPVQLPIEDHGSSVDAHSTPPIKSLHPDTNFSHSPAPDLNPFSNYQQRQSYTGVMGVSPWDMPQHRPRPTAPQQGDSQGISLIDIPEAPQRRRAPPRRAQQGYVNKPFKPPVEPEQDVRSNVPEADNPVPNIRRPRQRRVSQPGAETFDFSQPRRLSPPPNNTDIRSFIGPRRPAPVVDEQDIDENTAPSIIRAGEPSLRTRSGDFVPASELDLDITPPSIDVDQEALSNPRLPRRRKTGERTLVQITGNRRADEEDNDDPSYEPQGQSNRRRRTIDGGANPKRTKSAKLPLERVPEDQWMQTVILPFSLIDRDIRARLKGFGTEGLLLPWNEPAVGDTGALKTAREKEIKLWSARLEGLLGAKFPDSEMVEELENVVQAAFMATDA